MVSKEFFIWDSDTMVKLLDGLEEMIEQEINEATGGTFYTADSIRVKIEVTYEPENK